MTDAPRGEALKPVHLRPITAGDIPRLIELDKLCFEFPWSKQDFAAELLEGDYIGMVATAGNPTNRPIGYLVARRSKEGVRLASLAVQPEFRRQGIGKAMMNRLVADVSHEGRDKIVLEVRESNLAAQLFFRNNGFQATRIIPNRYSDTPEDAYEMRVRCRVSVPREQAPKPIHLRRMTGDDIPGLVDLEKKCGEAEWSKKGFHDLLDDNQLSRVVVATTEKHGHRPVGYLVAFPDGNRVWLSSLVVHPDYRRQGVATAMINRLGAEISRKNPREIIVEVGESNPAAKEFFDRCGFRTARLLPKHFDDLPEDFHQMRFPLPSLRQKATKAIEFLQRSTKTEWELVQKNEQGRFLSCDPGTLDEENGLLALRPRQPFSNHWAARRSLSLSNQKIKLGLREQCPDDLIVLLDDIRDIELSRDEEGRFQGRHAKQIARNDRDDGRSDGRAK